MPSFVIIDSRVAGIAALLGEFGADAELVLLDSARDGVEQIRSAVAGRSGIEAIHIISHGRDGALYLGGTVLDAPGIDTHADTLSAIGRSLVMGGDILLYGCNVAQGVDGQAFVEHLAAVTGADVAASSDATGPSSLGGNWDLEYQVGDVGSIGIGNSFVIEQWSGLLDFTPRMVYAAYDGGAAGNELWMTDGTTGGTQLLKDLNPLGFSDPQQFVALGNGKVVFVATDQNSGQEIWVTDGTPAGSTLLKNVDQDGTGSFVQGIAALGDGKALFAANDDIHGLKLWITDGTTDGTSLLDGGAASPTQIAALGGGRAVFRATDASHGTELWVTDGTSAGTLLLRDLWPGSSGSNLNNLVAIGNGKVLFSAAADAFTGNEPWVTDGTAGGTILLKDIDEGGNGSSAGRFTPLGNGTALFSARNGVSGTEGLWFTDGTPAGTTMVQNFSGGPNGWRVENITSIGGGKALFSPTHATYGQEVWITDGTPAGTLFLKDIEPGIPDSMPANFVGLGNGRAIFSASNSVSGTEPWVTDGTAAGTVLLKDINPGFGSGSSPANFQFLGNGRAVFTASQPGSGTELWISDGTPAGTILLKDATSGAGSTVFSGPGGLLAAPELDVTGNALEIVSGDRSTSSADGTDFGEVALNGAAVLHTFVLNNTGNAILNLGSVTIEGPVSFDFSVVGQLPTTLAPGSSTNLQVVFDPSWLGPSRVTLTLANSDADESSYSFDLRGFGVNSAPVVSGSATFPATPEGTLSVDFLVSDLLASAGYADADGGPRGIAITAATGPGYWLYSSGDGLWWGPDPQVSGSSALLLEASQQLRFVPAADQSGTAELTLRGWDQTTDTPSSFGFPSYADVTTSGGTTAFSSGTFTASMSVSPVNDGPALAATSGRVTTAIGTGNDSAQSMVIQADGKIVLAGYSSGANDDVALVRYNADGSLDASFDGDGRVTTAIGAGTDQGLGIALQADQKILVAGVVHLGNTQDFALLRYNPDGSLDTSFGGDGIVTTDFVGSLRDYGQAVTVQGDGRILVAGVSYDGPDRHIALARYNTDGSLDTSFSGDGQLTTNFTGTDAGFSIAIQADGRILVGGERYNGSNLDMAVVRYDVNGNIDTGFGTNGQAAIDFLGSTDQGFGLALQSDGKILVAGVGWQNGQADFGVARLDASGSFDNTFGTGGRVSIDLGGNDFGESITVQSDGKILVAGSREGANLLDQFALVRLNANGSLDTGFDSDGIVTTAIGASADGHSVQVDANGKIVVAGTSADYGTRDFAVVRYNADGGLDSGFGAPRFVEGGSAVLLDEDAMIADAELDAAGNYAGASVSLARHGGANGLDVFDFKAIGSQFAVAGNELRAGSLVGPAFATFTQTGGVLTISFTSAGTSATPTLVNDVLRHITYANAADAPPASVQIDWTFSDGNSGSQGAGGDLGAAFSTIVVITASNDAPLLASAIVDQSAKVGQAFHFVPGAGTFTDPDAGDTLVWSAGLVGGNVLPSWLTFNSATHSFDGTPTRGDAGVLNVKVMVTDSGGTAAVDTFSIAVQPSGKQPGHDFAADGKSDILWRNASTGGLYAYQMNGAAIQNEGFIAPSGPAGWQVIESRADFGGDGRSDILWWNDSTHSAYLYQLNGTAVQSEGFVAQNVPVGWDIVGTQGDYNGDGKADILWKNTANATYIYLMNGSTVAGEGYERTGIGAGWQIRESSGDYNGDGKSDILWQNGNTGALYIDQLNGTAIQSEGFVLASGPAGWQVIDAKSDLDGDGKSDILWHHAGSNSVYAFLMNGNAIASEGFIAQNIPAGWDILETQGDYNADGRADILWKNSNSNATYIYLMNGLGIQGEGYERGGIGAGWNVADAKGDYSGDGRSDILWRNANSGDVYLDVVSGTAIQSEGFVRMAVPADWVIA